MRLKIRQLLRVVTLVAIGLWGGIVSDVLAAAGPKDGEIALPADYKSWPKFLSEVQREDAKQVRELYVNPLGARACPVAAFPNGTRIVMELYKAKADGEAFPKGRTASW
jgi:hemoglobin